MSPRSSASALSPGRWPLGRLAASLLVLFALALLALNAAPAQAQARDPITVKLVSNTGQTSVNALFYFNSDHAQAFTTGSHAAGYTLTRVDFLAQDTNSSPRPTYTVSIHSDSDGSPGASLGTLTNMRDLPDSESIARFTTDGITLAANTTYWVVFDISSVGNGLLGYIRATSSADEDAVGLPGWSIADSLYSRGNSATTWSTNTTRSLKLAIHGEARGVPAGPPVLQRLTLETDATTITLAYDRRLANSIPATSAFSVNVTGGTNPAVSSVAVSGNEVTLTLSAKVTPSGAVTTVTYVKPTDRPIRSPHDPTGVAASFTNRQVNWAPVLTGGSGGRINAPPQTLVSLSFNSDNFGDPDGGALTFTLKQNDPNSGINDTPLYNQALNRIWFMSARPEYFAGLWPPAPYPFFSTVRVVATDPDGATAETNDFNYPASWEYWTSTRTLKVDGSTLTVGVPGSPSSTNPNRNLLDTTTYPSSNPFTVKVNGVVVSSTVSWAAGAATLTLSEPATRHDTVTLSFTNPDGQLMWLDSGGTTRAAGNFEDWHVTNVIGTGPHVQSVTADGTELKVHFGEVLSSSTPEAAAFTVTADGSPVQVTGVSVNGDVGGLGVVTLTLESAVSAEQTIRVAYNRHLAGASPAGHLLDGNLNVVPSFGAMPANRASLRGEWFNIPFHRPVENYEAQVDSGGNYGDPVEGGCTENFTVRVDGEVWPAGVTFGAESGDNVDLWRQVATDSNCADIPHAVMFWTGEGEIKSSAHQEIITGQHVTLTYDGPYLKPNGDFGGGLRYTDGAQEPVPAFTVDVSNDHGAAFVNGNVLTIEFGVPLDDTVVLDTSDFEVTSSHSYGRTIPVTSAIISGNTATLTLAESIPNHATVGLFFGNRALDEVRFYDDDGDKSDGDPITSAIVDLDGNDLVYVPIRHADRLSAYPSIPVKVLTPNTPPQVVAAGVDYDTQVILRFNEEMDTSAFAPGSAFTLTSRSPNGATRTFRVNGVPNWAGSNLRLHLESAPPADATLTLSYRKPSAAHNQLKDANGLALESFSNLPVNNGRPIITDVDIASDPGPDGVYTAGEKVQARLTFSDYVIVNTYNGTPRLRIHLGDFQPDLRWATFESGWGTTDLTFGYTLTADDIPEGSNGILQSSLGVKQNTLDTNGGTIWSRYVRANRSAHLSHPSFPRRPDPTPPTVTSVAIVSDPGPDRTYELGDVIKVGLTFSEPVYVDDTNVDSTNTDGSDDMPTVVIDLSNRAGDHRLAYYRSSEGGNQLIFEYIVTARDTSTQGVEVLENSLKPNGGLIKSHLAWSDHHADLSHPGVAPSRSHLVDPAPGAPTLLSVNGLGNNSTTVTLIFNKELDTDYSSWPGSIAFDITVDGERRRLARNSYPHVDFQTGRMITFELAERLGSGDKMVTYTKPSTGGLRDLFGNEVESFVWPIPVVTQPPPPAVTAWLWGANVIVRDMSRGLGRGCSEDASLCRYSFDNEFEYEGATYEITTLRQSGDLLGREVADDGSFYFALDKAWPADLRNNAAVCIGSARLELADADYQSGNRIAAWPAEDHEASLASVKTQLAGSTATVRLFETASAADATCPPTGQQQQQPPTSPSTAAPTTVTAVAVTSDAGADDTYGGDDVISVAVTFSGAVKVTGSPQITIDMDPADWGSKQATYASGSETATLTFTHTVVEPNFSSQGIAVLEDTLSLNGGSIRSMSSGKNAVLSHTGLAHDSDHKVNWETASDTSGGAGGSGGDDGETSSSTASTPTVTAVAVTSDAGSDDTYALNDEIQVTLTFSEAVDVTGAPQLKIKLAPNGGEKRAAYSGGSGTTTLTFAYTVAQSNLSTQGIAVLADTLALNGGSIQSAADADADLSHSGLAHDDDHKVDGRTTPTVTAVAITSDPGSDDTYRKGDVIQVTVTFSEAVDVDTTDGTPRLTIKMDPEYGEKQASYASGSGSTSLTFTYTVAQPNLSTQGIAVLANTLALNGGSIESTAADADADLAHTGLAHDADHKVDWRTTPTVSAVAVTSDPGDDDTYRKDDVIQVTVTFSEAVDVDTTDGTPRLTIKMDPEYGEKQASYQGGSGTASLTFAFTVVEPNFSDEGIAVLADTLQLNGGSIESTAADMAADLSHSGLAHDADHQVDWQQGDEGASTT